LKLLFFLVLLISNFNAAAAINLSIGVESFAGSVFSLVDLAGAPYDMARNNSQTVVTLEKNIVQLSVQYIPEESHSVYSLRVLKLGETNWKTMPPLPLNLHGLPIEGTKRSRNMNIVVFDFATESWSNLNYEPMVESDEGLKSMRGKYMCKTKFFKSFDDTDSRPLSGQLKPDFSWRTNHSSIVTRDGKLIVYGGQLEARNTNLKLSSTGFVFDLKTKEAKCFRLPRELARNNPSLRETSDGRILVLGGVSAHRYAPAREFNYFVIDFNRETYKSKNIRHPHAVREFLMDDEYGKLRLSFTEQDKVLVIPNRSPNYQGFFRKLDRRYKNDIYECDIDNFDCTQVSTLFDTKYGGLEVEGVLNLRDNDFLVFGFYENDQLAKPYPAKVSERFRNKWPTAKEFPSVVVYNSKSKKLRAIDN